VLVSGIEFYRRQGASDWQLEDVQGTEDKVAVVYSWRERDGSRSRLAQVLRLKAGKIMRMRDFANPAQALRTVE